MTAAAWIVALLAAYPHLAHRACVVARASQIAADADSAAAPCAALHAHKRRKKTEEGAPSAHKISILF